MKSIKLLIIVLITLSSCLNKEEIKKSKKILTKPVESKTEAIHQGENIETIPEARIKNIFLERIAYIKKENKKCYLKYNSWHFQKEEIEINVGDTIIGKRGRDAKSLFFIENIMEDEIKIKSQIINTFEGNKSYKYGDFSVQFGYNESEFIKNQKYKRDFSLIDIEYRAIGMKRHSKSTKIEIKNDSVKILMPKYEENSINVYQIPLADTEFKSLFEQIPTEDLLGYKWYSNPIIRDGGFMTISCSLGARKFTNTFTSIDNKGKIDPDTIGLWKFEKINDYCIQLIGELKLN